MLYWREDERLSNLVGVVRIRTENETPQYVANAPAWSYSGEYKAGDFPTLTGFIDHSAEDLLHYFSLGGRPSTQKGQSSKTWGYYKSEEEGAKMAIKHQQFIELVPFFVRPDCQADELQIALCRLAHYLRFSPAWDKGNIVLPYPLHMGQLLIKDQVLTPIF